MNKMDIDIGRDGIERHSIGKTDLERKWIGR